MSSLGLGTSKGLPPLVSRRIEQFISNKETSEAGQLANFMVSMVESSFEDQLAMLIAPTVNTRLEKAVEVITKQVTTVKNQLKIVTKGVVRRTEGIRQFPRFRPQGTNDEESQGEDDVGELAKRIESAQLSPEAAGVVQKEMKRLRRMQPAQAEYGVCRTYIENILDVPWVVSTDDQLDASMLARARKQLNDDHYGLDQIKRRLLEYLAVLRLKSQLNQEQSESQTTTEKDHSKTSKKFADKSPILLLVGPPGTGKTSLAKSVATALGRKFHRISLGGVRDEAEIRGHRRT